VKRIVFLSTAYVHGLGRAAPYQEEDALDPQNAYAKSKKTAEDAFWSTLGDERSIGTVLRPPPVFGKGGHGLMAALVRLAKSPTPLPLKGIGAPRSVIAVDHLSEIISLCLTSDGACGETFLVADDEPVRPEDIVRAVRGGLNRPAWLLPAPIGFIRLAAKIGCREHAWELRTRPCLLNTARIKAKLGWTSPMPTMEKIRTLTTLKQI
jgi:UDP-glucose 4-epimerase